MINKKIDRKVSILLILTMVLSSIFCFHGNAVSYADAYTVGARYNNGKEASVRKLDANKVKANGVDLTLTDGIYELTIDDTIDENGFTLYCDSPYWADVTNTYYFEDGKAVTNPSNYKVNSMEISGYEMSDEYDHYMFASSGEDDLDNKLVALVRIKKETPSRFLTAWTMHTLIGQFY